MTIESQRGATRYRVNPSNPCDVQMQTGPGRSWLWHSYYSEPEDAKAAVMQLGRPQPEQEATP